MDFCEFINKSVVVETAVKIPLVTKLVKVIIAI